MLLPNVDRINDAICEIVEGVTDALETDLRTTFGFQARNVDLFYRRDSMREGNRFNEKFVFSRGLVTEDANDVQVVTSPRRGGFLSGTTVLTTLDLRDVAASAVVENKDQFVMITDEALRRGVITVQDFRLFRTYVQVTYDAGIAEDRNVSDLFLQEVPSAGFALQGAPSVTFADSDPDTITRDAGSWTADGFRPGDVVVVGGTASNDGTFVVDGVSALVLTLSAADSLTAEVIVDPGISVGALQAVPSWLRELAILQTMAELTTSDAVAGALQRESRTASKGEERRGDRLERQIGSLMDKHVRYEPGAHRPVC